MTAVTVVTAVTAVFHPLLPAAPFRVIHKTIPNPSTIFPPLFCCFPLRSVPFRFIFLFYSVLFGTVVTVVTAVTAVTVVIENRLPG
ncbi:MAG: hypothetical protein IKG89_02820 [Oscillospiraceae bacterium]|nr:hypothetical protein [Oscillospiraceae bacterium]